MREKERKGGTIEGKKGEREVRMYIRKEVQVKWERHMKEQREHDLS